MRIAVIADDLTGAADCGVQFARSGYRTAVIFEGAPLPDGEDLDALAQDTNSRELDAPAACERAAAATASLRSARILYKKLDSTLRGNVAAELGATLEVSGRATGVLAPAFPETGRTTSHGTQMVYGEPLNNSEFARDSGVISHKGRIPWLLREGGLGPVSLLGVDELEDREKVETALVRARWIVADAESEEHLEALTRAIPDPTGVVWAGSAGLARALGRVYRGPRALAPQAFSASRVLAVVGSTSAVASEQLRILADEPHVEPIVLERRDDTLAAARRALAQGRNVAVCSVRDRKAGAEDRTASALAEVVAELEHDGLFDGLILTGGDTAARVASALGAVGILLDEEVEPGVPAGSLLGPRPYPVVTKAGGFGKPATLKEALRFLTGGRA